MNMQPFERVVAGLAAFPSLAQRILATWSTLSEEKREAGIENAEWILGAVENHVPDWIGNPDALELFQRARRVRSEISADLQALDLVAGSTLSSLLPLSMLDDAITSAACRANSRGRTFATLAWLTASGASKRKDIVSVVRSVMSLSLTEAAFFRRQVARQKAA